MDYAEYVVTGWVLTAAALAAYGLDLARRTRRAQRLLAPRSDRP